MKVKNEEAMANLILKEAEAKESLRKRISESAWGYYTGRYLFGLITSLLLFGILIYFCIFPAKIPIWGLYPIARRVDAIIKPSEFDSNGTNASIKAGPNQQDT
jgi:hypothetical protein